LGSRKDIIFKIKTHRRNWNSYTCGSPAQKKALAPLYFTDFPAKILCMISLTTFGPSDFDQFIAWLDNEELLIAIAGTYFTYPVTTLQLHNYLADTSSIAFNVVDITRNKPIGHAEIILKEDGLCKLDKVIVGDSSNRGKGVGGMIINELLKYCFDVLHAKEVELNVYDWNIAGIKCYEKAGFTFTDIIHTTQVKDNTWTAKNMVIDKNSWMKASAGPAEK
jgi:RimJ/RimL family protein N-acetyltransferase